MKKKYFEIIRRLYRERFKKKTEKPLFEISEYEQTILNELNLNGIVILKNYYSKEFCSEMITTIENYIKNKNNLEEIQQKLEKDPKKYKFGIEYEDGSSFWIDKKKSDFRIIHAEKINEKLKSDFFENDFLKKIGINMLKGNLENNFAMANKTQYVSDNLGSGGGWHRDNNYQYGFKALVYLNDVDENNGPFEYLKRTFSIKNHILNFPYPDKYQFTIEEIQEFIANHNNIYTKVFGAAGTVVLFNTNGIHRGNPVINGIRYAITNYYK